MVSLDKVFTVAAVMLPVIAGAGFRALVDHLAEGVSVVLGDPVRSVEQTAAEVAATLTSGREVRAPYCPAQRAYYREADKIRRACPSHILFSKSYYLLF